MCIRDSANTSSSTSANTNVNTNNNINSGTMTYNNNNVNTSTVNSTSASTSNNVNANTNVNTNTSTSNNVNQNIQSGSMTNNNNNVSTSTATNNNNNTNNSTSSNNNVNQNIQSGTLTNNNNNNSTITQKVIQPPPTAVAPSMMSGGNADLCTTGTSNSVQTQIFGVSNGGTNRDMNCERLKLSKTLYDMGMKVAAVATMCQDRRVFDAMMAAGTPCPYEGKIGEQARAAWEENEDKLPKMEEVVKDNDYYKNIGVGSLLGIIAYRIFSH